MSAPQSRCRQPNRNCSAALQSGPRRETKGAAEMPDCGQRWKAKNRFPIAAHESLEIALAISTFPHSGHGRMEKWKSKTGIPTFPLRPACLYRTNQKRKEINPQPKTLSF